MREAHGITTLPWGISDDAKPNEACFISDLHQPRFSISTAEKSMVLTATHAGNATFPLSLVVPMAILGHKTNRNDLPEGLSQRLM